MLIASLKRLLKGYNMLYQLKRAGISQADLVPVYLSVVRPVLDMRVPCDIRIYRNTYLTILK